VAGTNWADVEKLWWLSHYIT